MSPVRRLLVVFGVLIQCLALVVGGLTLGNEILRDDILLFLVARSALGSRHVVTLRLLLIWTSLYDRSLPFVAAKDEVDARWLRG